MKLRKNDILLLIIMLLLSVLLAGAYWAAHRQKGAYVTVTVEGDLFATLPLDEDITLNIPSANGGENKLAIHNGTAEILSATCPDKLCVHQKEISHLGESLVCLPNKVIVTVISGEDSGLDAIALNPCQKKGCHNS